MKSNSRAAARIATNDRNVSASHSCNGPTVIISRSSLQEIAGIGPTRKRALLHHFGTLKAIERASVGDLTQVDGISAETARRIYEFFHDGTA